MSITTQGWPYHAEDEIQAVQRVLSSGRTNYWTGVECREFEKEFANWMGAKFAIALMNGTVALEAALYALDIGPGDEVITSCRTFIASASCIVMRGATPVLADVDQDSQNITVETIEACITPRTKAIIVVHLAGWPAEMDQIMALARRYGLSVIEDCAQAHGAKIHGRYVGTWGDVAAFSFCQDKILTTGGEGGMVTTHDEAIWKKIWSFKDHGKSYDKVYHQPHPPGFRWLHDEFGTNWRMTEVQAAIGRVQLKKLSDWLSIRRQHAAQLTEQFKNLSALRIPLPPQAIEHAYYKYYVFVRPDHLTPTWCRDKIMHEINTLGTPCFSGSCSEIYLEKAFCKMKIAEKPIAKQLGETSLMLLIHPTLTSDDIDRTAQTTSKVIKMASI